MGIRIQPREIDIPEDDPFRNDLLSREEPAEVLTHLVGSIEGPCVLAVDAPWGAGKTTFLHLWAPHLRNNGFPVVDFNAWQTDHSGDPFIALSSELTEGLRGFMDAAGRTVEEIKAAATEVLRHAIPGFIRFATAGALDIDKLSEKEIGRFLASYASDRLARHRAGQQSMEKFKVTLRDTAKDVSRSKCDRPLIVMIDDLDRCRPTYAVELLEVAKHLFAVHGVIFVLAVNRSELAHSIRALYGDEFNADGYLHRFFDVDFRLPDPERRPFIDAMLDSMQIDAHVQRTRDREAHVEEQNVRKLLTRFLGGSDISLREIAQTIHRLGLVFASLRADHKWFFTTMAVALILRTLDSDLYHRFGHGEASDLEVVDSVYERVGGKSPEWTEEDGIFERTIVASVMEMRDKDYSWNRSFTTPLLEKYQKVVKNYQAKASERGSAEKMGNQPRDPEYEHAHAIISWADAYRKAFNRSQIGFLYSVQRIELLSKELVEETSSATLRS